MLLEREKTEKRIATLRNQIDNLPAGDLICARNGDYYKWHVTDGHQKTYIPKKNREYAEQLAFKKYQSVLLDDAQVEKRALDYYFKNTIMTGNDALLQMPAGIQELLKTYFTPVSEELSLWTNEPYEKNPRHPENLTHRSNSGNLVRSKSEAFIDTMLFFHKIPFRYESVLRLGNHTLYPDFTIRHPKTGKYYYWEHFGMMDDPTYARNTCDKLRLYIEHGIIPSIGLITTYETKDNPLSTDAVQKILENYFLD